MKILILCLTLYFAASASAGIKSPDGQWQCDKWEQVRSSRNCTDSSNGSPDCLDWKVDYVGVDCIACGSGCGTEIFREDIPLPLVNYHAPLGKGFSPGSELHFTIKLGDEQMTPWGVILAKDVLDSPLIVAFEDTYVELFDIFDGGKGVGFKETRYIFKLMDDGSISNNLADIGIGKGQTVEITIRLEETNYLIFINGIEFAQFRDRQRVTSMEVNQVAQMGEFEMLSIKHAYVKDTC